MIVTLNAKAGREMNFERRSTTGAEVLVLSHLNSNAAEPASGTQMEVYRDVAGSSEVRAESEDGPVLTTMIQYDRCRFLFRGSPRAWEQIA